MPKQYRVTITLAANFGEYSENHILLALKKKIEYNNDGIDLKIRDIRIIEIDKDREVVR